MPEPVITPPVGDNNPTPPAETKPPAGENPVIDFSKLGDEQLAKVLEDPRIWKTGRLSELTEAQKQLKAFQEEKAKAETEALKKKGDFETLANQKQAEIDKLRGDFHSSLTNTAIMAEAAKLGVTDLDAATKLIDRANIKVNDDGTVSGVTEAVAAMVASKGYLVNGKPTPVGGGTNPANPNSTNQATFKLSEINDPAFYAAHYKEIMKAMATPGAIEDDLGGNA